MEGTDDAAAQQLQRVGSLRGGNFRIVEGGLVWGDTLSLEGRGKSKVFMTLYQSLPEK